MRPIDLRVLEALPRHLEPVAALQRLCFPDPWGLTRLRAMASDPTISLLAAEDAGGRLAGYAVIRTVLDEGELYQIATAPGRRRRGLGTALLSEVIRRGKVRGVTALYLEVRAGNHAALSLYRLHGFQVTGRRPGYYSAPREDALLMTLRLQSPGSPAEKRGM